MEDLERAAAEFIAANLDTLIATVIAQSPDSLAMHGEKSDSLTGGAVRFTLSYLVDALAASSPPIFMEGLAWARVHLERVGIPVEDLAKNLRRIRNVLNEALPPDLAAVAVSYLDDGLASLPVLPDRVPTFLKEDYRLSPLARDYLDALLSFESARAGRMILGAAERGTPVREIYVQVFQATQREIGRLWQLNEISVAQEHYCTAATQFIMSQLYPYLFTEESKGRKLLAACVEGELHEIGIRMVADFFEMEGWDTTYLGANTPAFGMVDMLGKLKPDLLAISATMPFHVHLVSELIDMVRGSPVSGVKIIVGGYPFNTVNDLWSKVGADAFARDADEALLIAGGLIGSA